MDARASFFWHDYETWGVLPRRDRPVQFAGQRTSLELEPIGAPVQITCAPADDCLPEPDSLLVTGLTPQRALAEGLPEHAFAAAVERELAAEGTIGVGYNSLRFDDEVTRFLFWRNLIDPYAREWRNGNSRWDLMDALRAAWSLRPEGIEWPTYRAGEAPAEIVGRPSFRLEHLTAANGIEHAGAHDALVDVRATIELARLLRTRKERLWSFCLRLRQKQAVWEEIGVGRPFAHISGRYASERGCLAIVWPLGAHPRNKNELIVWDLAHDPRELAGLDAETLRRRLFTRADALPEGESRLPIKTIHVNRSPVVIGNLKTVAAAAERWGLDLAAVETHAGHARALAASHQPVLEQRFKAVYDAGAPAAADVDEDLYGGFVGEADRRQLERLRGLAPEALATRRLGFDDGRLEELVFRYRARNFAHTLGADERERWDRHRAARLHGGEGGALTIERCLERIDVLAEAAAERGDERAQALMEALSDWAVGIAPPRPA